MAIPSQSIDPKKRSRITTFYSSDEDEDAADQMRQPLKSIKLSSGHAQTERQTRAREAKRLEPGRQELPIWQGREAILQAARDNDTVVILGETGSGKTTQVPHFLLRSEIPCPAPRIACTQPRRVAAISLAARVAAEVGVALGKQVGYTVRFDDKSDSSTRLKYMTDGALLAEMLGDRDLDRYDVIVLDEAHERSLRTDMLMGFLKDIQARRRDKFRSSKGKAPAASDAREPTPLKIVVMSATIDAQRFSDFFDGAPVLFVKGRQHDVQVLYAETSPSDYVEATLKTIFQIHLKRPPGDILVFLPGQEDIESLTASIHTYCKDLDLSYPSAQKITVCPLYAKLGPSEQARAFDPARPDHRKVILATNVAETSVTIPGIKYVIDTGLAKEKKYHASIGIDTLVLNGISQSSALQRTGRAGRESAGICYRLYTEASFLEKMPKTTIPEIQRVSLTFALLHLLAAGQDDVYKFKYMDNPSRESINFAMLTLLGLGAITNKKAAIPAQITPLGRRMASLPLDPVYARILLASFDLGCGRDMIDLVALLGSKDTIFINSIATRDAANAARDKFIHRTGDHLTLLNVLRAYDDIDRAEQKTWCRGNFINHRALGQVLEARRQLTERCGRLGLDCTSTTGDDDSKPIRSALVTGLFNNVAFLQPDNLTYKNLARRTIAIHPSSVLMHKDTKAPAIVYDELTFTTREYARGVSAIDPRWIQTMAPNIFKKSV